MRPLIGISADYTSAAPSRFWLREEYAAAVWEAGGWPLILAPLEGVGVEDIAGRLAGLVISGGDFDIEPGCYGEAPAPGLGKLNPRRSRFELALVRWAMQHDLPVLGICGGLQAINVAAGGTLIQDLGTGSPHQQGRDSVSHPVQIKADTLLAALLRQSEVMVNSTHHQAIKELAPHFRVGALAPEGVIEAIESQKHRFILGLQWHPEVLYKENPLWLKPFLGLLAAAREFQSSG